MTLARKSCKFASSVRIRLESSLRIRTLIILWIVLIVCCLHIWIVNLNNDYNHFVMHGNKQLIRINDSSVNSSYSHSEETIRENRSTIHVNAGTRIKRESPKEKICDKCNFIEIAVAWVREFIYKHFDFSGISITIGERVADKFADSYIDRFNVHLYNLESNIHRLFKVCVHYYFFIWIAVGVIGAAVGIFGIHENIWRCLTLSVFFFYLSIFSLVMIILELNIDSGAELRMLVLLELTGALWINFKEWMILINVVLLLITGLLIYFMYIVRKYRKVMIEESEEMKAYYNTCFKVKASNERNQQPDELA
ncbi:uncharacterized protein LOC135834980 [Planococcus citri]|uniref:uncharacterized protein LOC135834980 n=1 Tax=Planococcus citri TaxID=170843 RepID=UPI0031F82B38